MTIKDLLKRLVSKVLQQDYGMISKIVHNQNVDKNKNTIYLLQTPAHTNIGDHAIAEAEIEFISGICKDYNLVEINQSYHYLFLKYFKKKIKNHDIILLHGGGNLGNEYLREEEIRRSTVKNFPDNKIIVFPQTVYYSKDPEGLQELKKTQKIFAAHSDLTLIAREKISYQLMQQYFPENNVLLTPDIVLSLKKTEPMLHRKGILMVLRGDAEKILDDQQTEIIKTLAERYATQITYSDMHYHKGVADPAERKQMLNWKFNQFKTSELVITDRLHGMVFAAVTGTPCIAFSNYNQKVSGTYEWIKELEYIRFLENPEASLVEQQIQELMNIGTNDYHPEKFTEYFNRIKALI